MSEEGRNILFLPLGNWLKEQLQMMEWDTTL